MYIHRTIEKQIKIASESFPVLVLCGPRQVGKSTTLLQNKPENMGIVSLDDLSNRSLAISDPKYFLEQHGTPLLIDEIQYAPNLLPYIKEIVDKHQFNVLNGKEERKCLYYLTGSEQFHLMKDVSESLAGRAGVLNLNSFSLNEIEESDETLFSPSISCLKRKKPSKSYDTKEVFKRIYLGGMPGVAINKIDKDVFFSSYLSTYIERDVKELLNVSKSLDFFNFMQCIAVRTAQEINYATIARELGVDSKTIKSWVSVLEASGIIYLLRPYSLSPTNRIIKSQKLYFMDTGLCSYLAKYPNSTLLEAGALSGAIFETFVVSEIVKNLRNHAKDPDLFLSYYRDKNQKEIDLVYEESGELYPIEIKKGIDPNHPDKNFSVLDDSKHVVHEGIVICMSDELKPINSKCWLCPISYI